MFLQDGMLSKKAIYLNVIELNLTEDGVEGRDRKRNENLVTTNSSLTRLHFRWSLCINRESM